jgi:vancomycin resistance protein VanW
VRDSLRKFLLGLLLFALMTGGFAATTLYYRNHRTPINPHYTHMGHTSSAVEPDSTAGYHRYGRPCIGPMSWERNRLFHEICAKYHTSIRMSAFQTTLPDPLPGEEYNVALAADMLAGTIVPPGRVFSTNKIIGPYNSKQGFKEGPTYMGNQLITTTGGGVCKIASTLYNVVTLANLKIIERRPHGMLVPYVPPGQDATVSEGNKDFKFKNNSKHSVLIWADTRDNTLYMAIYGDAKPPKVIWHHQILQRQNFNTIYRNNRTLKPGETKVVIEGAEGMTVKNWLMIEAADGTWIKKELGVDYYRPMTKVIERRTPN